MHPIQFPALTSIVIAVIGLLIYALTAGKISEAGRIMFWVGLLAFLLGH